VLLVIAFVAVCETGPTNMVAACRIASVADHEVVLADALAVRHQTMPPLEMDQATRLTVDATLAEFALNGTIALIRWETNYANPFDPTVPIFAHCYATTGMMDHEHEQ
jgi:hypothetical protein